LFFAGAALHPQRTFLKKGSLNSKNFIKLDSLPTATARTPNKKNTANTSLVQALLGLGGIFLA